MMLKNKLRAVTLSVIALSTLLFWQNCGRVNMAPQIPASTTEASTTLTVSSTPIILSSMKIVLAEYNTSTTFNLETEAGSAAIQSISFSSSAPVLTAETAVHSKIVIDASSGVVTYTPPNGFLGGDSVNMFMVTSDGTVTPLAVVFKVSDSTQAAHPVMNALVYGKNDTTLLNLKLAGNIYTPPTMSTIFAAWSRFVGPTLYTAAQAAQLTATTNVNDPVTIALSWQLLLNPSRISCNLNTSIFTGFISSDSFEAYTHDAVLTSPGTDDDSIFVVIAFTRIQGSDGIYHNHILSAVRNQGGNTPNTGWGLVYWVDNTLKATLASGSVNGVNTNNSTIGDGLGWNNRKSLVRVVRTGDTVQAYASGWNTNEDLLTLDSKSLLTVDLSYKNATTGVDLSIFKGAKPYGYATFSQADTTFLNVNFSTGQSDQYLYDLENKLVYEKISSGKYQVRNDIDAFDHIGSPRKVYNLETGKTYQLNADKTYTAVQ